MIEGYNIVTRILFIILGLIITAVFFMSMTVLYFLLLEQSPVEWYLRFIIAAAIFLSSFWLLKIAIKLFRGTKHEQTHLISPLALRIVGFFFITLPVASIFTGYFTENPKTTNWIQVIAIIITGLGALGLASERSLKSKFKKRK